MPHIVLNSRISGVQTVLSTKNLAMTRTLAPHLEVAQPHVRGGKQLVGDPARGAGLLAAQRLHLAQVQRVLRQRPWR